MPTLSIYIPFGRSRGLLLRLVAVLTRATPRSRRVPSGRVQLPDYLRRDVGLLPKDEHPPPLPHLPHRFPF